VLGKMAKMGKGKGEKGRKRERECPFNLPSSMFGTKMRKEERRRKEGGEGRKGRKERNPFLLPLRFILL